MKQLAPVTGPGILAYEGPTASVSKPRDQDCIIHLQPNFSLLIYVLVKMMPIPNIMPNLVRF